MKNKIKSYLILIPISGLIIVLDQWTKSIVRQNLGFGEVWMPLDWLSPYARIVHWYNTGVAFGLFQDRNLLFSLLSLIISLLIFFYYPKLTEDDWILKVALGLQLGGSVGNLVDRLLIGHVTDFISVGNFPVFNIADSGITVGVIIMILGLWWQERKDAKNKKLDLNRPEDSEKQI